MNNPRSFIKRVLLAGGLALGVLGTAVLSGSTVGADAPPRSPGIPALCGQSGCIAPPISPVEAKAAGTYALVSFTTIEPAAVTVDYKPVPMMGAPAAGGQSPAQGYATTHERKLTGLTSNTAYDVTVTAQTQSGQKHTAKTSFATLKKRVRITLQSIDITDDGDSFLTGDGEPRWMLFLSWTGGVDGGCYPISSPPCTKYGKFGEGRFTPLNSEGRALQFVFAEENFDHFPDALSLRVAADEKDNFDVDKVWGLPHLYECITGGGCPIGEVAPTVWRVPQGVETASQIVAVRGDDTATGFESMLTFSVELTHNDPPYPTLGRNMPYRTWK